MNHVSITKASEKLKSQLEDRPEMSGSGRQKMAELASVWPYLANINHYLGAMRRG